MKVTFINGISALLVLLFTYTAASKFLDLPEFKGTLYNQPFPHWLSAILVWMVPLTEVAIILCLLYERTKRTGLFASLAILTLFTVYIAAILLHFFKRVPCSCGGIIRQLSWRQHLWLNLLLLLLTGTALLLDRKKQFVHQKTS